MKPPVVEPMKEATAHRCKECGREYWDAYKHYPCSADNLKEALHQISLCSQNSASSKEQCGQIAREALMKVST